MEIGGGGWSRVGVGGEVGEGVGGGWGHLPPHAPVIDHTPFPHHVQIRCKQLRLPCEWVWRPRSRVRGHVTCADDRLISASRLGK